MHCEHIQISDHEYHEGTELFGRTNEVKIVRNFKRTDISWRKGRASTGTPSKAADVTRHRRLCSAVFILRVAGGRYHVVAHGASTIILAAPPVGYAKLISGEVRGTPH